MPYNPNDPTSDLHNPEGVIDPNPPNAHPPLTVSQLVDMTGAHTAVRGQHHNARFASVKLQHIYDSLVSGIITKDTALKMIAVLEQNDIPKWVDDEVSKNVFDQAIAAIKAL